jgi:hypothetical protein
MAEKSFPRNFANFKGLDNTTNQLLVGEGFALETLNCEMDFDGSLILRKGEKVRIGIGSAYPDTAGFGLIRHTRLDRTTGATIEGLLGVSSDTCSPTASSGIYELKIGSLVITSPNASGDTFEFYGDGSTYKAALKRNGVALTNFPFDCGTGLVGGASLKSYEMLKTAIEGNVGYSATITPRAVCTACTGGRSAPLVVAAGHTIRVGDTLDFGTGDQRTVTRVNGNDIYWTQKVNRTVTLGQVIGVSGLSAAGLPIMPATSIPLTLSIPIYYWGEVHLAAGLVATPFGYSIYRNQTGTILASGVNLNDATYVFASMSENVSGTKMGLLKYDGQGRIYRAGLLKPSMAAAAAAGGSLTASSTYKYVVTHEYKDKNGKIIESDPSDQVTMLTTASNLTGNLTLSLMTISAAPALSANGFNLCCAKVDGNQSGASTQTGLVVKSGAVTTFRAGDVVTFIDHVTGTVVERTLTAVSDALLVWASTTAVSVVDTEIISCNLTFNVYRTKASGQTFYLAASGIVDPTAASVAVVDTLADTGLGRVYTEPDLGREHQPPPVMFVGCDHQGLLVGARNSANPNSVFHSLPESPEYFPAAYNTFDVPSTVTGPISAIASDGASLLMVAKKNGRYAVAGDLDSYAYTIEEVTRYYQGVPSQSSITKVLNAIFAVSEQGMMLVSGGSATLEPGQLVYKDFAKNNEYSLANGDYVLGNNLLKLVMQRAVTFFDARNQQLWVYVPAESGRAGYGLTPSANSKLFVFDTVAKAWYDWGFNSNFYWPSKGITLFNGELHWAGYGIEESGSDDFTPLIARNSSDTDYDYSSGGQAIRADYRSAWDTGGEPNMEKVFTRIKLTRLADSLPAQTIRIQTYENWKTTTPKVDTVKTFAADQISVEAKLVHTKSEALQLRIRNCNASEVYTVNAPMRITAYEFTASTPMRKEDVK